MEALIETDGLVAAEPGKDPAEWVHHLKQNEGR